jgi:hypothetical protein
MPFKNLQLVEKIIINRALRYAEDAGWNVAVNDGEQTVARNVDPFAARAYMATTNCDVLTFQSAKTGKEIGWMILIYGNGEDLIHDYAANDAMEHLAQSTL